MIRPATFHDLPHIMSALIKMLSYSQAPQMKFADPHAAERSVLIAINEGRAFFTGAYFIMVDVGSDWYSDKKYLIEQLILRVYPPDGTMVYEAVDVLAELTERFSCVAVAAGDTQMGMMTPLYEARGYRRLGTQLFKETAHGVRPKDDGC